MLGRRGIWAKPDKGILTKINSHEEHASHRAMNTHLAYFVWVENEA